MTAHAAPFQTVNGPTLLRLLTQQRNAYQTLRDLADEQLAAVEAGASDGLISLLAKRQAVIDDLAGLNDELAPYRQLGEDLANHLPEVQRQAVRVLIDEIDHLLAAVTAADERSREQLEAARTSVSRQLNAVGRSGAALNAYGKKPAQNAAAYTNRLTDRRG